MANDPTRNAHAAVKRAQSKFERTVAYDEASEWAEIVANHDALHGLLAALSVEAA